MPDGKTVRQQDVGQDSKMVGGPDGEMARDRDGEAVGQWDGTMGFVDSTV